jgi:hypothetical protein
MLTFVPTQPFGHYGAIWHKKVPKWILICFLFSTYFLSCAHFSSPSSVSCTFMLGNIFPDCHNPTSSLHPISYTVVLQVMYNDNNKWVQFSQQKVSSAPTPSTGISISSGIPQGYTWYVDITLVGGQCARCAPSTGNGRDCPSIKDGTTGWYAGVPQRTYTSTVFNSWPSSFTVTNWTPMANVSCGCVVPN